MLNTSFVIKLLQSQVLCSCFRIQAEIFFSKPIPFNYVLQSLFYVYMYLLGKFKLSGHLFWKELLIQLTIRYFCYIHCSFGFFQFEFQGRDSGSDCASSLSLLFYLLSTHYV